jgi:hypothetical protein
MCYQNRASQSKFLLQHLRAVTAMSYVVVPAHLLLQLAAGVDREEGKYLPHGWRPFCPHRWMAEYLIAHKPQAADTAAAAAAASQGS